jgi:thioredoxin 1
VCNSLEQFRETIAKHPVVIIDAFATWCGPCKAIAPQVARYADTSKLLAPPNHSQLTNTVPSHSWAQDPEFKDKTHFAKFDVDAVPDLAQELGIRAMPTFLFFQDGVKVDEFLGANPPALLNLLKKWNPAETTEAADKAESPKSD